MESNEDIIQNGIKKYLAGELYAAKSLFLKYLEDGERDNTYYPESHSAYYYLALIYIETNDLKKAVAFLLKACELEPENATYQYRLGFAYMQLTAIDAAVSSFERTISLNPEHQRARFLLGKLYFQTGDMKKVLETMSDVLARSEDFYEAYYYRSIAKQQLRDRQGALIDINKTIAINPNFLDAYIHRARLLLADNDLVSAYNDCMTIYERNDKSYTFLSFFLNILLKLDRQEEYNKIKQEADILYSLT